jgi:hypothetical protein
MNPAHNNQIPHPAAHTQEHVEKLKALGTNKEALNGLIENYSVLP